MASESGDSIEPDVPPYVVCYSLGQRLWSVYTGPPVQWKGWHDDTSTVLYSDLLHSSSACQYCRFVLKTVQQLGDLDGVWHITIEATGNNGHGFIAVTNGPKNYQSAVRYILEVYVPTGTSSRQAKQVSRLFRALPECRRLYADTRDSASFELVRQWLKQCDHHHQCLPKKVLLPTRVVDLGDAATPGIRLLETSGASGQYTALTYCWGRIPVTVDTRRETLASRSQSVQYDDLPWSFRDAITVTEHLGLRYIWIDALCIIQDDLADWNRETAVMGDIYANAYVTIAPTSSADGNTPFLRSRKNFLAEPTGDRGPGRPDSISSVVHLPSPFQPESPIQVEVRRGVVNGDLLQEPLSTRAWCYQERLLSPRILSYGASEMSWEYNVDKFCECKDPRHERLGVPWSYFMGVLSEEDFVLQEDKATFQCALEPTVSNNDLYSYWRTYVVQQFTARSLTKSADRLPALAGIASHFANRLGDDYLAGLWRKDMLAGLCWMTWQPNAEAQDDAGRRTAPSWSWASIEGRVVYTIRPDHKYDLHCELVQAQCYPSGINVFGAVSGGSMTLRGHVAEGHLTLPAGTVDEQMVPIYINWPCLHQRYSHDTVWEDELGIDFVTGQARGAYTADTLPEQHLLAQVDGSGQTTMSRSRSKRLGQSWAQASGNVWGLLLAHNHSYGGAWYVLVLGRSKSVPDTFERLGLLGLFEDGDGQCWLDQGNRQDVVIA